jgi:hypothetical protein
MKSEHRHELQTNELGKVTEKLGSFLEIHGNRLMIGICVASLAASVVIYWVRTKHNDEAAAWRELSTAFATNKAEDFYDVWESHKGTPTGLWARVHEGESWLAQGVEKLFGNVELGTEQVKKARDAFQDVVDDRRALAPAALPLGDGELLAEAYGVIERPCDHFGSLRTTGAQPICKMDDDHLSSEQLGVQIDCLAFWVLGIAHRALQVFQAVILYDSPSLPEALPGLSG